MAIGQPAFKIFLNPGQQINLKILKVLFPTIGIFCTKILSDFQFFAIL